MEIREIWGIVLSTFTDELFSFSYIRVLTETKFESFKLNTQYEKCKFNHLLNPNYLLKFELIKTRKNWIVRSILEYKHISKPVSYKDFLNQAECIKIIENSITQDEIVSILPFVVKEFSSLENISLDQFSQQLKTQLGYS
jgi:hypothetical protein